MSSAVPSLPARRAVTLSPELRQHRCEVARYALANGLPLNLDAVTIIIATKAIESAAEGRPFTRWTGRRVVAFIWGTVQEWCAGQGVEAPANTAESLWTYLTFLFEEGQLASGSSPLGELRGALIDNAGVTRAGRARHPAGTRRRAEVRTLAPR
jgi:hypothetical protein